MSGCGNRTRCQRRTLNEGPTVIGASLSAVFRLALLIAVAAGTARAETGSAAGPAVLFVKGWGAETNRTLLVPVVC